MAGRPTKYTPERVARVVRALETGNTRKAAAIYAGINQDTLADWMKRYSDFSAAVEKAESDAEMTSVTLIRTAAHESWFAAAWWLERRRAQDWGKVDRVEVTFRQQAEKLATELGMTVEEVLAEADRIVKTGAEA